MNHPTIIQGGMGVGISNWRLARTVSQHGQLGVISGTGINNVVIRRLQQGDPDGHMRRAIAHFPFQDIAQPILDRYFVPDANPESTKPFKITPMFSAKPSLASQQLLVVTTFAEVFLAKEGHNGLVGINLMEKLQMTTLGGLYGAMLADVDYVLMGAGIPREIPRVLDLFANHEPATLKLHVENASADDNFLLSFDPREVIPHAMPPLRRPKFLAIIASTTLAISLIKKGTGKVDGFVIEEPPAGGHNAPPRGNKTFNERGEPIYGEKDIVDLEKIKSLGVPFWLAGSYATPQKLTYAIEHGAEGIQVGTAFALSQESGLRDDLRHQAIQRVKAGEMDIFTDPKASPTGFPFKVAQVEGTVAKPDVYAERPRLCDLGYLRTAYKRDDGTLGYRCASEPIDQYLKKGGELSETEGRKCLCNGLMATHGLAQHRPDGYVEAPLVTMGDDVTTILQFLHDDADAYSAVDVLDTLLQGVPQKQEHELASMTA